MSAIVPLLCAAHDVPPSLVTLDVGRRVVHMEVQLQSSELGVAMRLPLAEHATKAVAEHSDEIRRYVRDHIQAHSPDGRAYAVTVDSLNMRKTDNLQWNSNDWVIADVRLIAPPGSSTESLALSYSVIVDRVLSHQALVYVARDLRYGWTGESLRLIGVSRFGAEQIQIGDASGSWWRGFSRMFGLGMQHIAQGTDHLLFIIVLLLPTPLIAAAGRWGRPRTPLNSLRAIVAVMSGFTIGHSLTLALAAGAGIALPAKTVEILIAVSILVSALHAWRPLFPSREAWVATFFGLIHGMAFAEALAGLNFDTTTFLLSLGAFNLGIETMQLLIIASILPVLLVLSRSSAYWMVRSGGVVIAGLCATGWILDRAFGLPNPVAPMLERFTSLSWWWAAPLCAASAVCFGFIVRRKTLPKISDELEYLTVLRLRETHPPAGSDRCAAQRAASLADSSRGSLQYP